METHDETNGSTGSPQGRRLACERCRGQKLKCERSSVPDCCQRCRKADVQCSFELALPPGRRPRTQPTPQSAKAKWPAAAAAVAAVTESSHMDMASDPTGVVQPYHVGQRPASRCSATTHATPFDDDSIMDMLSSDNAHSLAGAFEPSFGDQVTAWSAAWAGTGSTPWDALVVMDGSDHALATATDDFMAVEFTPMARSGSSSSTQSQPQPTTPPPPVRASESCAHKQLPAAKGNLAALVRRAAELGDNMYELRLKYHDGHSELDPPGQFPVHMSGEVLQAAVEFHRLLRCFFLDNMEGCCGGSSIPALATNPSISTYTHASSSSLAGSLGPPEQPQPTRRISATQAVDRPAALTLIASYRRLLDLYLLYYQAVYEYARGTEPAGRRAQPIWRDLKVGGAPLREFGDLHIKLVVQAAARVLEDVEGALGLVEGCRVSRKGASEGGRDGGGRDGVLGTVVTSRFVEQCIAEGTAGGGSEQGSGVIARIREVAASLAAVLDGPMALHRL